MKLRELFPQFICCALWALPFSFHAQAQEHPFLSRFGLLEGDGQVIIDWTMIAGSTCDGIVIERSLDSILFEPVGRIFGLCGAIAEPVEYRYVDGDPPEFRKVYYRIELGGNGYSSIRSILLERLFSAEHLFVPSPVSGVGVLLLRVPPETVFSVEFWSASGMLQHRVEARGSRVEVPTDGWEPGTYLYKASTGGQRFVGRFVVL